MISLVAERETVATPRPTKNTKVVTTPSGPRPPYLRRDVLVLFGSLGDFCAVLAALKMAVWMRFHFVHVGWIPLSVNLATRDYDTYIILGSILHMVLLQRYGVYDVHKILKIGDLLAQVVKACCTWFFIFLGVTLILKFEPPISRMFVLWAFINSMVLLTFWRLGFNQLLRQDSINRRLRDRVLFIGWSKESDALAKSIRQDPNHPYEIIGCLPSAQGRFWVRPPKDVPVLGDYNNAVEVMRSLRPDIAVMADLDPVMGEIVALSNVCEKEHVLFKIIPSYFQIMVSGLHLETISDVPILGVSRLPLDHLSNRIVKRCVDILGGIVGLILSLPILAIFGYLIKKESPGPVFYSQIRTGREGHPFRIYKLRSMRLAAEQNGPQWTKQNDPRRLKIGTVMRKWNIDELPQFWNVIMGHMSLVGPRPERPELITNFKEEIAHYNARHYIRPGLTGWAQIHGLRGDTDLTERVKYDLYYVENWNVRLDFYTMYATVFRDQRNAY